MTATIKIYGIPAALRAFEELPRRIRFKHLRIALNAGGGIIRDRAKQIVRHDSGLLAKSLGVKVKIPDASFNQSHHGKPAYAVIGPKRRSGKFLRPNKKGVLKGFGTAQRELVAARKRLAAEGKLSPLQREREAVRFAQASVPEAIYRNPSRYAHLIEKGHGGPRPAPAYPFLSAAVAQTKSQVVSKVSEKLAAGIQQEAAALAGSR